MCMAVAGVSKLWLARETQTTAGFYNNIFGTLTHSLIHLFCTSTVTLVMAGLVSCKAELRACNA